MATDGIVTLSIEIELGWGGDTVDGYISKNRVKETECLEKLIEKCEKNNIPITFNIVGELINSERNMSEWSEQESDPFAPEYYAPDLIERLRKSDVDHEFATHTYSHYIFDEEERFLEEIDKASWVHEMVGLETPTSFVGPRNELPPTDLLAETDINTVRVPVSSPVSSNIHRFFKMLYRSHPISEIVTEQGIVKTYSTWETSLTAPYFLPMGQKSAHPAYRWLPFTARKKLHQEYLHSAIERTSNEHSHAHLWTHLYNMSNPVQWSLVSDFLGELGEKQRLGEISVKTMSDLEEFANVEL